jgi:hypothetical protein
LSNYDDDEPFPDDPEDGVEPEEETPRPKKAAEKPAAAPRKRAAVPPPLAEAEIPGSLQGEVRFTRSVRVGGRDDNAHYSVSLQFGYQQGMNLEDLAALAADYYFQAKSIVFQEANLAFTVDENGVVHEVLRTLEATEERPARRRSRDDDDEPEEERPRRRDDDLDLPSKRPSHIDADVWRDLQDNPDDWYDNRAKKKSGKFSANAPDFKNKDTDEAVWLTPPRRGRR